MSTPRCRIPKPLRRDVTAALDCFRDYLDAIENQAGASSVSDLAKVLGLELPPYKKQTRYLHPRLHWFVKDRKEYGPR